MEINESVYGADGWSCDPPTEAGDYLLMDCDPEFYLNEYNRKYNVSRIRKVRVVPDDESLIIQGEGTSVDYYYGGMWDWKRI